MTTTTHSQVCRVKLCLDYGWKQPEPALQAQFLGWGLWTIPIGRADKQQKDCSAVQRKQFETRKKPLKQLQLDSKYFYSHFRSDLWCLTPWLTRLVWQCPINIRQQMSIDVTLTAREIWDKFLGPRVIGILVNSNFSYYLTFALSQY